MKSRATQITTVTKTSCGRVAGPNFTRTYVHHEKAALAPDGYLFLGSSETLSNVHDGYVAERADRTLWYRPQ